MSVLLAVDTSSALSSLALRCADGRIECWESASANTHNEELASQTQALLERAGVRAHELSLLLYGGGPGSFTGLRISLGLFKGLALALSLPLRMHSSLAAAAATLASIGAAELTAVVSDARRGEVFLGIYDPRKRFESLTTENIVPIASLEAILSMASESQGARMLTLGVLPSDNSAFVLPESLRARPVTDVARGLLTLEAARCEELPRFDLQEMANLSPHYLRSVAAKTIAERARGG